MNSLFKMYLLCLAFATISCDNNIEEYDISPSSSHIHENVNSTTFKENMIEFTKILSIAINRSPEIRDFIKKEALQMFDNDYDILYHLIKNKNVLKNKSFRDILSEYANDKTKFEQIEKSLPLLCIYVPELPSGFNANTWNTNTDIPLVATSFLNNGKVIFYKDGEENLALEAIQIPMFPAIAVKTNERLKLKNNLVTKNTDFKENHYEFIDPIFDKNSTNTTTKSIEFSQHLFEHGKRAYEEMGVNGYYWQRDNIYYGMNKNSTKGQLDRGIAERILSLTFSKQAYYKMVDYDGNPDQVRPLWQEGRFEIKIDILINNTSGLGTTLTKYINASFDELFECPSYIGATNLFITPNEIKGNRRFLTNIKLVTWDLENNSFSWKYLITEIDAQETITRTETLTSDFATNFGFTGDASLGKFKIGLNFGASSKTSKTSQYTIVTHKDSDDLGTLETNFSDPILLSPAEDDGMFPLPEEFKIYNVYTVNNPYVTMCVGPTRIY